MSTPALERFVASLRPHDASMACAVAELLRGADADGAMERGRWLMAVRAASDRSTAGAAPAAAGPAWGAEDSEDAARELARYLEEHVLARLESEGIAHREPAAEDWQRVRLDRPFWEALAPHREEAAARIDDAVRILLRGDAPAAAERGEIAPGVASSAGGGSTLSARGLTKIYRKRRVVNDVELQVSQGEIVGLLGPNGAGKTTTFYMIVGLIPPHAGEVYLDDSELTGVPMYRRARRGIGYLAQEPSVFRRLSVEQNILSILQTLPLSRSERKERLERLLDELSIKHLRDAKAYSLSGGERRRLEITRALVSEPKFMLLDEPFAGIDPIAVHDIQQIVAGLRHRGIGVVITDHNVEQTLDIVDRAYIMYDGRVRVSGTVGELVWNDEVADIYFGPTLTARMRERYARPDMAAV
ncbi:MAG TPA: LPS export ABC transporter ATP-binding protein [Longimicrobiales bacterium]|nr:LPS export ABC transporter ATP-binding protein [Longimicrobiales bacterium]